MSSTPDMPHQPDPFGGVTTYTYDCCGRLTSVEDGIDRSTNKPAGCHGDAKPPRPRRPSRAGPAPQRPASPLLRVPPVRHGDAGADAMAIACGVNADADAVEREGGRHRNSPETA